MYYSSPHNNPADMHRYSHFSYKEPYSHTFNFLKKTEQECDNADISNHINLNSKLLGFLLSHIALYLWLPVFKGSKFEVPGDREKDKGSEIWVCTLP